MGPVQYLLRPPEKGPIDFSRAEIKPTYQSAALQQQQQKIFLDKLCLDLEIIVDKFPSPQCRRQN